MKPLKFDQIQNNEFVTRRIRRDIYGQENCNILILLNWKKKLDNANIFMIIYFKYLILYTTRDIIT